MGNTCSCFEGPCSLAHNPIPPPSVAKSAVTPRLVSLPNSEETSEDTPPMKEENNWKPQLLLDHSLCETSAVSQGASSPISITSATNSVSTMAELNPLFPKLPWLRDNQRIVSKLSRLSENVQPHTSHSGDSEDSHW